MSSVPITRDYGRAENVELEHVYPDVYNELRRLARFYMLRERSDHTLQPTALVHEAYLRLQCQEKSSFANRTQFISVAAGMMRRILVNKAVRRNRQKREGTYVQLTPDRASDSFAEGQLNLLDLEHALLELTRLD